MIEVLQSGPLNTVQDLGRSGRLRWGVGRSGAMDPLALRLANLLLGNRPGDAGLEAAIFPLRLRFDAERAFSVTGAAAPARLDDTPLPPDWAALARPGQVLTLEAPRRGVFAYVAFAGGLDAPIVMGARATDLKGGFGGWDGKPVAAGQRLALGPARFRARIPDRGVGLSPTAIAGRHSAGPTVLRFIAAAEWDDLGDEAAGVFLGSAWTVTREINRSGYRLSGPEIRFERPRELLSHGIVPGVIQIPLGGQPIVQMAEANTCGGYPKAGVIIDVDLPLLAQSRPGQEVRFQPISWDEALAARRDVEGQLRRLAADLELMRG